MNNYKSILLYSKFSNVCLSLRSTLKECPVDIEDQINLEYICIDNPVIRSLILKKNSLNVKYVPCLITVSEKQKQVFQGQQVINWFEQIVRNEMEKLPALPPRNVSKTVDRKNNTTSISDLFVSDEPEPEESKKSEEPETGGNAMSIALKMQKERESMMSGTSEK